MTAITKTNSTSKFGNAVRSIKGFVQNEQQKVEERISDHAIVAIDTYCETHGLEGVGTEEAAQIATTVVESMRKGGKAGTVIGATGSLGHQALHGEFKPVQAVICTLLGGWLGAGIGAGRGTNKALTAVINVRTPQETPQETPAPVKTRKSRTTKNAVENNLDALTDGLN